MKSYNLRLPTMKEYKQKHYWSDHSEYSLLVQFKYFCEKHSTYIIVALLRTKMFFYKKITALSMSENYLIRALHWVILFYMFFIKTFAKYDHLEWFGTKLCNIPIRYV